MSPQEPTTFENRRLRDLRCQNKDSVIKPYLRRLDLSDPENFHAVLMPNLNCSGLRFLRDHGVPGKNIYAVERDRRVHALQRNPDPRTQPHLVGLQTTDVPMNLLESLDSIFVSIRARDVKIDLFYLDFYGRAGAEHAESLEKVFGLNMLSPNGTLILTLGTNRSNKDRVIFQRAVERATGRSVSSFLVNSWAARYGRVCPKTLERQYRSKGGGNQNILYTTSYFHFGE